MLPEVELYVSLGDRYYLFGSLRRDNGLSRFNSSGLETMDVTPQPPQVGLYYFPGLLGWDKGGFN